MTYSKYAKPKVSAPHGSSILGRVGAASTDLVPFRIFFALRVRRQVFLVVIVAILRTGAGLNCACAERSVSCCSFSLIQ